ncbi:MAG: recombinase family protein, partial [Vicinamibacterales bacterium]
MRTRAVGYVRVSTEEQVDGRFSLDAQRHEIARYCERMDYELVDMYSDEGVSAHVERIEKRPCLVALLDGARRGAFDVVVVHTLDRWARNVGVQRLALQRLGDARVSFASVTENIDFTTPSGKLMLTMMGGISEFFSDQLGLHVSKAKRERADSGLPVGPIPFGYRVDEPGGIPRRVEGEWDAVLGAFHRRLDGQPYPEIAAWL